MKHYPSYKPSQIQWIGEIPEHWDIKKIKHNTYVKGRVGWKGLRSDEFLDEGYAYLITGTDFKNGEVDWENAYHIDKERYEEDPYIQLKEDDLLITKDGTIGKLALVKELDGHACLNSGVFVVRPNDEAYITRFLYYVLSSDVFRAFINYTSYGTTINHLYQNVFVNFPFPFPDKAEQTAIANFLDHKTTQIDQIITDKEKLIKLYEEEKNALINEAVTKGINPKAKMKDSGIEWLGEMPEHWEVKRMKYCADITRGAILRPVNEPKYYEKEGEWRYLNISDVTKIDKYLFEGGDGLSQLGSEKSARVEPGNLILTASATIGKPFINKIKVCIHDGFIAFKNMKVRIEYLYYFLKNPMLYIAIGKSNTQKNIYLDEVKNMILTCPPQKEQDAIVEYIENGLEKHSNMVSQVLKEIELLKEYRQSLIFEAVTGKIDVRSVE